MFGAYLQSVTQSWYRPRWEVGANVGLIGIADTADSVLFWRRLSFEERKISDPFRALRPHPYEIKSRLFSASTDPCREHGAAHLRSPPRTACTTNVAADPGVRKALTPRRIRRVGVKRRLCGLCPTRGLPAAGNRLRLRRYPQ